MVSALDPRLIGLSKRPGSITGSMGNGEQWFPFLAFGNLSVNCPLTGYGYITNTLPTVRPQC